MFRGFGFRVHKDPEGFNSIMGFIRLREGDGVWGLGFIWGSYPDYKPAY